MMKKKEKESGAKEETSEKKRRAKSYSWEGVLLLAACHKRRVGGPTNSTPIVSWKEVVGDGGVQNTIIKVPKFSARKLGAALWEFQQYFSPVSVNPNTSMYMSNPNPNRARRHLHRLGKDEEDVEHLHHGHHRRRHHPTLAVDHHHVGSPDHHPASAGSLRRHIATLLIRHYQSADSNKQALQPLSPASYGSSLEMAPYNPATTPDSSVELRGRIGESSYSFKTSTELLKVLNRIWTLEEQHASNVALVKALKNELDHARGRIKELLRDKQTNRHEIDELLKQISNDNLTRKSKEQERLEAALQSVSAELEDERKLRKRSEGLHRKLARELFEVKVALSTSVKDLDRERKSTELLEQLCNEFAQAIIQMSDKNSTGLTDQDKVILVISESWINEQGKIKDREAQGSKISITDKLRQELEAFVKEREIAHESAKDTRRCSLESIPEAKSAPQCEGHEDSAISDSHHVDNQDQKEVVKTGEGTPAEISMLQKSDVYDSIKEGGHHQRNKAYDDEGHGSNSKTVDKLISELILSEGRSFPRDCKEGVSSKSSSRRNASPIRQWMTSLTSFDPRVSESSTRTRPVRDNTLKSKLQEPKSKEQRSRLKILKGSS